MLRLRHRLILTSGLAILVLFGILAFNAGSVVAVQGLPQQISDEAFWAMISEFSEPGGNFRSDNFVSNENTFQYVIPDLKKNTKPGGVYLGVGPDQNFTYIVALQPKMAFIVDIRRQNMLLHLMYKALTELSTDRAEFLSRLFSRKRPADVGPDATAESLFLAYDGVVADRTLFQENLTAITERLVEHHGFTLTSDDVRTIEYVYGAFFRGGPDLTYSGPSFQGGGRRMPSYAELMMETDADGLNRSYMATEDNFRVLQELQKKNLVIPLVGDFAGPKAIRSLGQYLNEHGATVAAVYTSNVEQYLFQQSDDWSKYYSSVSTLPVDSKSTFIRAVFNMGGFGFASSRYSPRSMTLLCPIANFIEAFNAGKVTSYWDVIHMSK